MLYTVTCSGYLLHFKVLNIKLARNSEMIAFRLKILGGTPD